MEKTKIKAVYFDAGETLIYRNPSLSSLAYRHIKKIRKNITLRKVEDVLAASALRMADAVRKGVMKDTQKWEMYISIVFGMLGIKNNAAAAGLKDRLKGGGSFRRFPDALFVLRRLKKMGLKTGVISNAPAELRNMLKKTGLYGEFDDIIVSEEAGVEKPDIRIFKMALKNAGCKPCEMIYVGDNYLADIEGAGSAGIIPLWIRRKTRHAQFSFAHMAKKEGTDTIRSLTEVLGRV